MSNDLILKAIESAKCRIYKLNFDTNGNISSHHQKKAENQKELMEVTVEALERQLSVKPNIYGLRYGGIALGGKCPVCGRCVNSKDYRFCHWCGTKLDWEFDVDWRKLFNEQSSISN